MALFQKNPYSTENNKPLYTLGMQKNLLIVGLGNVGKQYVGTRHNIGFNCVDAFAHALQFPDWHEKRDLKCYQTMHTVGESRVVIIKPTTLMNLSGEAVQAVAHFYKITNDQIVVVHDELDIPFGQIRTRMGGGSAGNNGIKSIIKHIGEDFGRVRIGIQAETPMDSADFVLAKFSKQEQEQLPNLTRETATILSEFIHTGQLQAETRNFLV